LTSSIQRDGQGRPIHIITFVQNINARKEAEQLLTTAANALLASEARYRTAFQMSLDAIAINRLSDGMYIEVNEAFLNITGFKREDVIGKTSFELGIWANPHDRRAMVEALRETSSFRDLRTQFRRANGEIFWGLTSASLIELDNVACILVVSRDISDAKAAEDKIRDLAFFDPLTRLPNRRLLVDRLQQALAASTRNPRKRALLFVDLDNFKTLNDAVGHQAGDLLLQEVARRLVDSIRDADTVARLGGDEFVVMLEDLSEVPEEAAAWARQVGEKLLVALGQPYHVGGRECHCPSSIGITVFGVQQQTPNEVLQQAEIAMFQAKGEGRNAIHIFSPALQAAVNARASMEQDLRQAIRNNQFSLFYQPQVNRGGLIGAEALIRWNHPRRGLLPPGEFIPLAEETGMILSLGDWVLEAACAQIAAWALRKDTPPILVAINISARQFRQPDFVDHVLAALHRTGADPHNLKLELTESMLVDNIEEVIAKMTQLRTYGLRFALDDFGTGYSSLAYLKRLPLDELKIDRAFVRDILVDATSGAIAQTINSLGHAMGLSVIAEGVETEQQRAFLAHLGCQSYQGFLFSRPLPLEEFERSWMDPLRRPAQVPQ
jgi:diguanylate cyclase (GGDEF)-like protein/PAS domain S-box-containing protein